MSPFFKSTNYKTQSKDLGDFPVKIIMNETTFGPDEAMKGTVVINQNATSLLKSSLRLDKSIISVQFHGVERTSRGTNVFVCEDVHIDLISRTEQSSAYSFCHSASSAIYPSANNYDAKIIYQVAVRVLDSSLDPRLGYRQPVYIRNLIEANIATHAVAKNSSYSVSVPPITKKMTFNIKAVNPSFSNIKSVTYKLYSESNGTKKSLYRSQIKVKGWIPEIDPQINLQSVTSAFSSSQIDHKYFLAVKITDHRTTSKFCVPVQIADPEEPLPAYSQ